MARPQKEINWDVVLKRMECGNTAQQIYMSLGITDNTFYNRFKEEFGVSFQDYSGGKLHEVGKSNIIYTQYMKALSGNTRMLELLGAEWCGQKQNRDETPKNDELLAYKHENMILRAEKLENANEPETRPELQTGDPSV